MRIRQQDSTGDIMPVTRRAAMANGLDATTTVINNSLHLLSGEWWQDEDLGFEIPSMLYDGIRVQNADMLTSYISAYIGSIDSVTAVTDVSGQVNGHKYTYECTINTEYGATKGDFSDAILYSVF